MSTITIKKHVNYSLPEITTFTKIALCYLTAHLSAISAVGLLYMLGIFDVGFLAPESFAVKFFKYVDTLIS